MSIKDTLLRCFNKNKLIQVFHYENDLSLYSVGYIIALNETQCILDLISSEGFADGLLLFYIDSINKINTNCKYLNYIDNIKEDRRSFEQFDFSSKNLVQDLLLHANKSKKVCQLYLSDENYSDVQGQIITINNEITTVLQLTEFGEDDGESTIRNESIRQIRYNGLIENALNKAYSKQSALEIIS